MSTPVDQMQTQFAGAVDSGVTTGTAVAQNREIPQTEIDGVKKLADEYKTAREFDKTARQQYNKDRRYASGTSDLTWASDANIIGSFIDILVSFLYAKNPDVSVRPSAQAGGQPDKDAVDFAETLQIVIGRLWKDARLKKAMKKLVRSSLSVGPGWVKALVYSEQRKNPEIEKQIHDAQDNIAQIQALQESPDSDSSGSSDEKLTELNNLVAGLTAQVELLVKRGMCIDFCRAEDVQVSLDVAATEDYLDADWISNDMYIRRDQLRARFATLTEDDCRGVAVYFLRQTGANAKDTTAARAKEDAVADGQFTKDIGSQSMTMGGDKPVEFVKITELWDHRDNLIKTMVDGVKRWAIAPYAPPQASTRFYPYFRLAFFETDGSRHPQSLSWRMRQLQDEYSAARSGGRKTRERSIPGTVFLRGQLDPEDVKKLEQSDHMEMIGIQPTDPNLPLDKVIGPKPIPRVDPAMFDTTPIHRDMQIVSGVQEAQQQSVSTTKTATEAEIQQTGFASRTGADRDVEEELLNELAQYTAELAVQSLPLDAVQKIAGPLAFWPVGMAVEDVLTMVDVEIAAGTTGKPQARADKETWATLLPLIQQMMQQIPVLQMTNPALALGYRNLMRETLKRLDDRLNIDSIMPPAPAGMPGMPPAPGGIPGVPGAPPGAPPVGNGTVNNPATVTPPPAA